jgi:hypothetical protein
MKFLRLSSRLRTVFIFGAPVLGVLLPAVMAKPEVPHGFVGKKPSVVLRAPKTLITIPCQPGMYSAFRSCPTNVDMQVPLTAVAKGFSKPTYSYNVGGGRIIGEGSNVTWDLYDAGPGFYRAIVEVQDHKKHRAVSSVDVTVQSCADCISHEPCMVPILVSCYDKVNVGTPITCKVVIGRRVEPGPFTFEWSARDSSGNDLAERISRQGEYVSIRTDGLGGQSVTATVEIKGLYPSCARIHSGSTVVKP